MSHYPLVAFWAAVIMSNVWAASANPYSTLIAALWLAYAVVVVVVEIVRAVR